MTTKLIEAEQMNKHRGGHEAQDAAFFSKQSRQNPVNKSVNPPPQASLPQAPPLLPSQQQQTKQRLK